jgi:hypothetical protein
MAELEQEVARLREALAAAAQAASGPPAWWAEWWRRATLHAHPDRGGSVALMTLLNEARERFRSEK